jgi:hypothetical protein
VGLTSGFDKGKEKVVTSGSTPKAGSQSPPREPLASSEKKRRLVHSDGSSVSEPALGRQHASSKVAVEQVGGSSGGRPGATQAGSHTQRR